MSIKVINFDLNFIPTGVPPIVHIHQYDLGEIVTLRPTLYYRDELYNGMNLEECDFIVAYQRPDGSQQSYTIENHVFLDEYVFEFPLDANMTAMHGPNVMSLGFVDRTTNNILWTQNFILFIERHPIQSEDYIGSSAYDGMIRMLQRYIDEAYAATPPGYEEHIAKIREVENTIDDLRDEIQENLEEANNYTDQQMGGLDSIYATLQDVTNAQNEGRAYAGTLIGDAETRILNDMSLSYQLKSDAETDKTDLQIYAEQVSTASATEIKDYLGLDYTSAEPGLTDTGLLNTVITQTAESIVQEATAEFMTESEADGIITSRVNSKVEQKANEITTTVAQLYETKEDANRKLSDAQSYARSQISQKAGEITTTVKAYTDETISNLKIGAQNLLRGTNEYKTTDESDSWVPTYNNGGWKASGTVTASELDDNPGNGFTVGAKIQNGRLSQNSIDFLVDKKAYVVHMYLKGSGLPDPHGEKAAIDSALKNIVYFRNTATGNKLVLDYATETDQETGVETVIRNQSFNYHYPYKEVVTYPTYTEEDEQGNQVTKVRKQVDYVEITDSPWRELEWYILCDEWPENVDIVVDSTNGTLDVCGIKMEEGSKATAWQPNEFDIKKYTNTQIQQTNERISLIAEAQDTTDDNVSAMNSRLDVEAGKIAAMVAAGYIEPDGNQGWTSSYSTQQENRIMNQVSSAYATKDRVNEVESKIVTTDTYTQIVSRAVSGIKIGGENLIRSVDLVSASVSVSNATWSLADNINGWNNYRGSASRIDVTDAPNNNIKKGWRLTVPSQSNMQNFGMLQYSVPATYQQEYTISMYVRCVSGSAKAFTQAFVSSHTLDNTLDINTTDNAGWTRVVYTFTWDDETSKNSLNVNFGVKNIANTAAVVEICGMKLELGNVATDWCPSVYDMEAYTQASLTVATDSITAKVTGVIKDRAKPQNILLDTDAPSNTAIYGPSSRYSSDAANASYMTIRYKSIENDSPTDTKYAYEFGALADSTGRSRTIGFYSTWGHCPFIPGRTYILTFYARLTAGTSGKVYFNYYDSSRTQRGSKSDNITSTTWQKFEYSFTYPSDGGEGGRIRVGATTNSMAYTLQITDVVLVESTALAYSELKQTVDGLTLTVDDSAGKVSQLEQTAEGLTSTVSNMSVGGVNMLQDVNVSSLNKVNAAHNRYFSDSSISEVTPTMVAISDPPNGVNVSYGSRFVVSAVNASRVRQLCWYSGGVVPFVDGETYTVSCYGRIVSGDTMRVSFQFGTSTYKRTTIDSISGEWARYKYTFTYNKSDYGDTDGVGTRVYIGVMATYTGTFELCGFQCEKGTFATAFSEESVTPSNIISRINQTAESVTIDASKINFNGSTFFTNLQSDVQNAVSGSIKRIYYRTTTNSQPSAPSSGVTTGVTSTATTAGGWRTVIPDFSPGNTYYWTCEEYKKNDDKFYYTNVSPFHATIVDGANIYAGSITLTKFDSTTQNTISTASSDASTAKSDAATAKTTAENAVTRYGRCTTDAATAAKTVTLTTGKLGTLATGAVVAVYFTKANSAETPTLNVNNTGAKQIRMVHGTAWTSGSNWKAGAVLTFTYDGTYWIVTNGSQTKDAYDKANAAATNASNALTAANKAVVESVTVYYCHDRTAPTQPTDTEITETSSAVDQWTLRMPDPVYNGYYYECTQQKLNDGTITFTKMRRMSFTEGIAKWISSSDATKIDGGHIYANSVDTGALNLYGLLQINQTSSGTVGGYIGFESGVTLTNGDYAPTDGFRLYSSNKTHYIHTSTDGLVIHANNYLQLYNSGSQRTHMYTDTGMDFRTINDSTGDPQLLSVSKDGSSRKPLTIGASYLYFDAYNDYSYFKSWGGTYTHTIASDVTTSYKLQIGHSSRLAKFVGSLDSGSDIRLKENVDYNGVPDVIDNFKVCSFVYKNDENKRVRYGLIAQDVLTVDQNLVDYDCDETGCTKPSKVEGEEPVYAEEAEVYFTLRYTDIIPMLIQKCQKLQKQIDELKGESS